MKPRRERAEVGQGQRAHWERFKDLQWDVRNMEWEGRREMEKESEVARGWW